MFKKISSWLRASSRFGLPGSESLIASLLGLLVVVGPWFIIPWGGFGVVAAKNIFVAAVAMIIVIIAALSALKHGRIMVPNHPIFLTWIGLCAAGFLGAVLSKAFVFSLAGYLFEPSSWVFLAEIGVISWYSYRVMRTPARQAVVYGGLAISFLAIVMVTILRFVLGGDFANFGVLWNTTATLVGTWSDLGVIAGVVLGFAVITLELAPIKRGFKWVIAIFAAIIAAMLVFMNLHGVWAALGFMGLALALYLFTYSHWDPEAHEYRQGRRVPWFSLALVALAVAGMFLGSLANGWISKYRPMVWSETRPGITMTTRTAIDAIMHNPVTGYGPNGFGTAWSHAKPPALSSGNATNADFSFGYGTLPTQMATNGILGIVGWVAWTVLLVMVLLRVLMRPFDSATQRYGSVLGAGTVILFGVLAWTTNVGTYPWVLFAITIGMLVGQVRAPRAASFIKDPRTSFFGIVGILAVSAVVISGMIILGKRIAATVRYTHGTAMMNQGNQAGIDQVVLAATRSGFDDIHHEAAKLILATAASVAGKTSLDKAAASQQVEQLVGAALGHAQAAIQFNKNNYRNWIFLGDVYRTMAGWGINGSADHARAAYDEAAKRNPSDAGMQLNYAQLALATNDSAKALDIISQSIDRYPTRDAYLLRAQIAWGAGNYDSALAAVSAALGLDPRNPDLAYEYGQLLFSRGKYSSAVSAFLRTIAFAPQYGPAYGYLGVSYERSGDIANANRVYDYMRKQSPDQADRLIAQIKNQTSVAAPAPIDETKSTTPDAKKPVAPAKKKQ